ncbi:MAG: hypothetical protein V1720_21800 [bacterium]
MVKVINEKEGNNLLINSFFKRNYFCESDSRNTIFFDKSYFFRSLLVSFFIFIYSNVTGQISFGLSTTQEYNSNPFRYRIPEESFISNYEFSLENESESFSAGYYGDYYNFAQLPDWNFYWHQIAIWKDFESSTITAYYEQRFNGENTSYFDYYNLTAYYANRFLIGDFNIGVTPNFSLTKYPNIPLLDNWKGTLNLFVNRSFESGTTFILGGLLNYKKYLSTSTTEIVNYYDEQNVLITDTLTGENISSLFHITSYLRIAQSLTASTGLAVQYTNRSLINNDAEKYKSLNLTYGDESEIFDDPVNYESNGFLVELTQVLFDDMVVKAGYYFSGKTYPSQGIYDKENNYDLSKDRTDTQHIFNLSLSKEFEVEFLNNAPLSVGMNYQMINNSSNSYWFKYNNNSFNLSLGFAF